MGLPFWVQLGTILKDQLRLCGGQLLTTYPANTLNMIMNLDVCMGPRKNDFGMAKAKEFHPKATGQELKPQS